MDSKKVLVRESRLGKSVFSIENIDKGELIAAFDGDIFECERATDLPPRVANHAIQFEEHKWRDSNGLARSINHSCNPNCGIKNLFSIVAMKDIKKEEELTWDYDMSEDSDWTLDCQCLNPSCRKKIGAFKNLPRDVRSTYRGYISDWLVDKYKLSN